MPVRLRKLKGGKVRVSTPGGVKSYATTLVKALGQERLLNAIEHSPGFRVKRRVKKV